MDFPPFQFMIGRGRIGFLAPRFDPEQLMAEKSLVLVLCKEGQLLEKAVSIFEVKP